MFLKFLLFIAIYTGRKYSQNSFCWFQIHFCLEESSSVHISIYEISRSRGRDCEKITMFRDGTLWKLVKVFLLLTFCPWIWKYIVHSSTASVSFCRIRYCHMAGVLHANVMYKSYAESNLQWVVNKTSNEKKFMLCTKNTYIIKLLLNIVTTEIETLITSGSKFLYACVREVCRLWA
jgi:hypothetical protein